MAREVWNQGPFEQGGFRLPPIGRPPAATVRAIVFGLLGVLLLMTTYYQVEPAEVGVVQRFGKFVRTTDPGPHLKIPFGIETVTKVPVQQQLNMEFGFRTLRAAVRTEYAPPNRETIGEAVMLTGDLNVAVVEWIVQYRIKDPKAYLFNVRDPKQTFQLMTEAAMRQVVGDHSVDEVLTIGREDVARLAKEELQRLCEFYGVGIEVQQLVLQDVNPPDLVKPAFNDVNQAIQEKEKAINEAWAEYNQAVPKAKGEAEQAIRSAEGYALERENNAIGDAQRFEALYEEYRKAPAVTRKRLYLETMRELIPKMGRKVIVDDRAKGVLSLLSLDGEKKEVKP